MGWTHIQPQMWTQGLTGVKQQENPVGTEGQNSRDLGPSG